MGMKIAVHDRGNIINERRTRKFEQMMCRAGKGMQKTPDFRGRLDVKWANVETVADSSDYVYMAHGMPEIMIAIC